MRLERKIQDPLAISGICHADRQAQNTRKLSSSGELTPVWGYQKGMRPGKRAFG